MTKLLQVVAYNLAKSRTARDGNRLKRKNFRPRHIKINHPVLVRNHTTKPFEARSNDYICVGFKGNNQNTSERQSWQKSQKSTEKM